MLRRGVIFIPSVRRRQSHAFIDDYIDQISGCSLERGRRKLMPFPMDIPH
jgi:hypothetical protein